MNPFPLVREGSDKLIAQACGKCGTVYHLGDRYHGDREARECCDAEARKARETVERERQSRELSERSAAQDKARVAAARRVPAAGYEGPVFTYDGDAAARDGYFRDLDELAEMYEDEGKPLPAEVWACTARRFALPSAQEIVDSELESGDWHEDMGDWVTGVDALQAAVDAFNAAQTGETWDVDYTRRVVLTPSLPETPAETEA